jgi:hypothetical protein
MSGTLPTVHGTGAALYPVLRHNTLATGVQKFLNGSEQRFQRTATLADFQLQYTGLFASDRNALMTFYASQKGAFDSTWSFGLSFNTYTNMTFLDDSFTSVESARPNQYDVSFKFRQTANAAFAQSLHFPSNPTYPTLSTGATSQRPYSQIQRNRTTFNDNPTGKRYSYAWYAAGLTGFPTRGLYSWKLEYPAITDADMATLETFFVQMNGRYSTFSLKDPDSGVTYASVRFDQDAFSYKYVALNQASTTILLAETGYLGNSL